MMRFSVLIISCISLLTLVGCKKNDPPKFHWEYFGLEQGRYVIYDVMDIEHDQALGKHDTSIYQLKTVWGDTIIDNEGRVAREFIRYKRSDASAPWVLTDVWTGIIDGIRGELIEENQRKVKLVFAPTLAKVWDANAYNMLGEMQCYYRDIHQDTIINNYILDSTVVVEQEEFVSLIDTVKKYEVYAKGIGLVGKFYRDNQYQFGNSEVVLGTESFYKIVSTGLE